MSVKLEANTPSLASQLCSECGLVLVRPLHSRGNDASVGGGFLKVGHLLVQLVGGLELAGVVRGAIADHNLRGVLVGHHDGGLWQERSLGHRVVGH